MPTIIQIVSNTGRTIYLFIWNASGQVWSVTNSAFEAYNVAHWSQYVITCTESASSGNYFASIPAGILAVNGFYSWSGYVQLAGSPAAGDTPVSQGNFQNPSASTTGLAALIYSLRVLAQDTVDSKTIWSETLGASDQPAYPVDGSNKLFRLKSAPLSDIPGSPVYTYVTIVGTGSVQRDQSSFTVLDQINGIIQFTTAPNPGSAPNGVYMDYNYIYFSDAKYSEFLSQAANDTLAVTSDPTAIVEGLKEAMLQFALARFWFARASQYANQYRSSGGDASEDIQTVSQTFISLGRQAQKQAKDLQTAYYQRQGQRDEAGYADINHNWDPISPIR